MIIIAESELFDSSYNLQGIHPVSPIKNQSFAVHRASSSSSKASQLTQETTEVGKHAFPTSVNTGHYRVLSLLRLLSPRLLGF